jgi:hypothetical protein
MEHGLGPSADGDVDMTGLSVEKPACAVCTLAHAVFAITCAAVIPYQRHCRVVKKKNPKRESRSGSEYCRRPTREEVEDRTPIAIVLGFRRAFCAPAHIEREYGRVLRPTPRATPSTAAAELAQFLPIRQALCVERWR